MIIDASHEPIEENVAITKRVVERAHAKGLSVEAELGRLGGLEEDVQVDEGNAVLTDPKEAVEFVCKAATRWPAKAQYTSSLQIMQKLVQEDPGNNVWQELLAASCDGLGDELKTQGDLNGAS